MPRLREISLLLSALPAKVLARATCFATVSDRPCGRRSLRARTRAMPARDDVVLYGQYMLDRKLVRQRRRAKRVVLSV
jgi:hypothetical protein